MIYTIPNNQRYYSSDCCLSSASRRQYVLEEYPSRLRNTPEYNPLYDAFRPITPPLHYNQQYLDTRQRIYDKPSAHYFDPEQQQRNFLAINRRHAGKQPGSYHLSSERK
jgi:hypothetical protein